MANDIFSRAKRYRKLHPRTAWTDCVKAVAGKATKKAAVGSAKKKKPAVKKVTVIRAKIVKISGPKRHHVSNRSIGAVSLSAISHQQSHLKALEAMLHRHQAQAKAKGLTAAEKAHTRREITKIRHSISATKKHIQSLKKSI